MLRVGLTGGLATGKSFAGRCFEELGCHWIQADKLGHQVLAPDGEAYEPAVRQFGRGILDAEGRIDRRKLASVVFADPAQLGKLNAIVHPAVYRLREALLRELEARDPQGIAILEVAILIETGGHEKVDKVILVICEQAQQIERAMARGLTREEAIDRLSRQMPVEAKRPFADYVIDTSGSEKDTRRQVREIYRSLRSIAL